MEPAEPTAGAVRAFALTVLLGIVGLIVLVRHLRDRRGAPPPLGPPEPARWEGPDVAIVILLAIAVQVLLFQWAGAMELLDEPAALIILGSVANLAAAGLALACIVRRGQGLAALGVPPPAGGVLGSAAVGARYFLMAFPFVYGLQFAMQVLFQAVGREPRINPAVERFLETTAASELLLIFVAAVIIAPVVEEVLFRGFLYGPIRERWGRRAAVVVTAVLFGLVHPMVDAPATAVLGGALALSYERSRSLVAPIAGHLVNNVYALLLLALHRMEAAPT